MRFKPSFLSGGSSRYSYGTYTINALTIPYITRCTYVQMLIFFLRWRQLLKNLIEYCMESREIYRKIDKMLLPLSHVLPISYVLSLKLGKRSILALKVLAMPNSKINP